MIRNRMEWAWFLISISMVANAKPQLAWLIPTIDHAGSNPSDLSIDWRLFYIYSHNIDMSSVWLLSTWHVPVLCLVAQSCPALCNPMDCSPPDSSVHRIFQARILEWVAILFCRESSPPRDRTQVLCIAGGFFTVWATREARTTC